MGSFSGGLLHETRWTCPTPRLRSRVPTSGFRPRLRGRLLCAHPPRSGFGPQRASDWPQWGVLDRDSHGAHAHGAGGRACRRRRRRRGHVRARLGHRDGRDSTGRRLDPAHGRLPDVVQPAPQPLLDHHLHYLQRDGQREVDHDRHRTASRHGLRDVFSGRSGLAATGLTNRRPSSRRSPPRRAAPD